MLLFQCACLAGPARFYSVFYHPVHGSFWAQLSDDTGIDPTPRKLAIASIRQNFSKLKALGFDTVTVALPDSDSWQSQHGSGFSYDPSNAKAAKPQFAVAQEILLELAAAADLKVIFAVDFSEYRRSTDGREQWSGLADEYDSTSTPSGAYDYIRCLINPTAYYGSLKTTELPSAGIPDVAVRSHVGDARIRGWILGGEWNPAVINPQTEIHTHNVFFRKYWNFFYSLVHSSKANRAFVGVYLIGQPGGDPSRLASIKSFKGWFAPATSMSQPDLIGIEFYGTGRYHLPDIYADLEKDVSALEQADTVRYPGDYAIPQKKIFLAEGGTDQVNTATANQYYQNIFQFLADNSLSGIQLWLSDSIADVEDDQGTASLKPAMPAYDLFSSAVTKVRTRTYAPLPAHIYWHLGPSAGGSFGDPTSYQMSTEVRPSAVGSWTYGNPTVAGTFVNEAMRNHSQGRNLSFYAIPNPIPNADPTSVEIYWDASKTTLPHSIEIHRERDDAVVVGSGASVGHMTVLIDPASGEVFKLIEKSNQGTVEIGRVTVLGH